MPLPGPARWQVDDRREPWLVATHAATHSELRVRSWRAARRVSPADCEAEARALRPSLPRPTPEDTLGEEDLQAPEGWRMHASSAVQKSGDGRGIEGSALAFAATVGHCLALVYLTRDTDKSAAARVGDRLAVVVEGMFSRVRWRKIEDRGTPMRPMR